jgi:hypothetical protein
LMTKYHGIEENNIGHHLPHPPFDLNDRACQLRIKDFCWRITEELGESAEALNPLNEIHVYEELMDALHFLVEVLINIGITPHDITWPAGQDLLKHCFTTFADPVPPLNLTVYNHQQVAIGLYWDVIYQLTLAANCLKLKPWKSTPQLTDEKRFKNYMRSAFYKFIRLVGQMGFTPESVTKLYLNKAAVNGFRQMSNY